MRAIDRTSPVPVYRQISDHYQARIREGALKPGARLPSLRFLQRRLGVARESVKAAMGLLAHEGYVVRIQGKGTFVAMAPPSRRFWGVVVPFYTPSYTRILLELRAAAHRAGARLEHACDYDDHHRQIEIADDFAWRRAEAILVVPTRDERETISRLRKIHRERPVVLLDHTSIASQLPYVIQDYVHGVRLALEHLARAGARRIAYVRDPLWEQRNPIYRTMEEACRQVAAAELGLDEPIVASPDDLPARGARRGERALPFDALFCVSDDVACLMTGLLRERGFDVPGDVQVVGYNDSDIARIFTPRITTIRPNLPRMCATAAEIIRRTLEGERPELLQHVLIPRLVARETTRDDPQSEKETVLSGDDATDLWASALGLDAP